jgi:hypothetical protein
MKRCLLAAILIAVLPALAHAGSLEKEVKARWLGAWVVTGVEGYSDCGGAATNNRIHANLVKSKGKHRFQPGELAKVNKIDVKKSRVDLHLILAEPLLVPYQEGPFTLYREARCKLELEIMVDREAVKSKDADALDQALRGILERYATEEEAQQSPDWNGREIEPYPDGYERTLAELAVWRAEQANLRVEAKLDEARQKTGRLAYSVSTDPDYLEGFARGIEAARESDPRDCPALLAIDLGGSSHAASKYQDSSPETAEQRSDRGYRDGRLFVYGLILVERLPGCFVPVPPHPDGQFVPAE